MQAAEEEDQHCEEDDHAEPGQLHLLGLTEDPDQQGQAGASKNHQQEQQVPSNDEVKY